MFHIETSIGNSKYQCLCYECLREESGDRLQVLADWVRDNERLPMSYRGKRNLAPEQVTKNHMCAFALSMFLCSMLARLRI